MAAASPLASEVASLRRQARDLGNQKNILEAKLRAARAENRKLRRMLKGVSQVAREAIPA